MLHLPKTSAFLCFLILNLGFSLKILAEDISFPANSGTINIKEAPYNAKGDGITDDSNAIIQAIRDNIGQYETRTLYFPNGTYLVSKQLPWKTNDDTWHCYLSFQGQSRDGTTIKLKDNSSGFDSLASPQAVVFTASQFYSTSDDPNNIGEGNEAYANFIQNLTIDVGENPGAIGIDFLGNNYAGIYDTKLVGNGYIGLSMQRYGAGPLLVKNLEIEGFQYGIKTAKQDYGITFENIILQNQSVAGISNDQNVLSIHNLTSQNTVTAIKNTNTIGHIVLIQAELHGGSSEKPAIEQHGYGIFLRNINTSGYNTALQINDSSINKQLIDEFSPVLPNTQTPPERSLNLEIKPTPLIPKDPVDEWANVTDFGANIDEAYQNKTQAIQDAMDSGATTVFLPTGFYMIDKPIVVPSHVQKITSPGCRFDLTWDNSFDDPNDPKGIFHISADSDSPLQINKIYYWGAFLGNSETPASYSVFAKHSSSRTLILHDIQNYGFLNEEGCGDLFLEDICLDDIHFNFQQNVWARQFNTESSKSGFKCINNGGNLWILGIKTELPSTIIKTTSGGNTEVLGGLIYPVHAVSDDMPAFICDQSQVSLSYSTTAYNPDNDYPVQVLEINNDDSTSFKKEETLTRGYGSQVPLYNRLIAPLAPPAAPKTLQLKYKP